MLAARIALSGEADASPERARAFFAWLLERVRALPRRDLVAREDGNPGIVPALRGIVAELEPGTPLHQVETMPALLDRVASTDPTSILAAVTGVLAIVAVATLIPGMRTIRSSPLAALREG